MSRRAKVYVVAKEHLLALARGEGRISLPHDAVLVDFCAAKGNSLELTVHSASFPPTPEGSPLPSAPATLQRGRRE